MFYPKAETIECSVLSCRKDVRVLYPSEKLTYKTSLFYKDSVIKLR